MTANPAGVRSLDDWARMPLDGVRAALGTNESGLTDAEAATRLAAGGPNVLPRQRATALRIFLRQLANPLLGLLILVAFVSFVVGQRTDAVIITAVMSLSVGLGFFDEYRANQAAVLLESHVTRRARVTREGRLIEIPAEQLVPGDLLRVETGDILPADVRLTSARDLAVDESVLTGESVAVEKTAAAPDDGGEMPAILLAGSTVRSGDGEGIVVATGRATMLGGIARRLETPPPVTEFQRGLRRFSLLLVSATAVLTTFILGANALLGRGWLESILFALAIAVGLTPQLLPAIVTVSLATGSRRLAARKVIVRHLVAIEDLGNIEVLFSDKTGTLTAGTITLERIVDGPERKERGVLEWAAAFLPAWQGLPPRNPIDLALSLDARLAAASDTPWEARGGLPFSYTRRAGAVLARDPNDGQTWLVVTGAAEEVLARCSSGPSWGSGWAASAQAALDDLVSHGIRPLTVAIAAHEDGEVGEDDLRGLEFVGFLGFSDPPKPGAMEALDHLARLGVEVKVLTGDHPAVAAHVCTLLGVPVLGSVTGAEMDGLDEKALQELVRKTTIFARVSPEQKAKLIAAAQLGGRDVGFLGDGVNDGPALRQADVGISVDDATDVAKAAADVVLLEKDLGILAEGIAEGRRTFANTVKYILMATSSNFGNMFSAAGASLFLSFLPMLPTQILLNNFLYDVSELTLPTDTVDPESTRRPAHWDIRMIGRFMLVFGPASSIYDFLTFALMLQVFHAGESRFQSGWFVESLCTQTLVIFVLRTRRVPFWRSHPSRPLLATTLVCVAVAILLPYSPVADLLGFESLPASFLGALAGMVVTYLALVEVAKHWFFKRWELAGGLPAPNGRD